MVKKIQGFVYILGDDINTDDIIPSHTLTLRDPDEMAKYTLEFKPSLIWWYGTVPEQGNEAEDIAAQSDFYKTRYKTLFDSDLVLS